MNAPPETGPMRAVSTAVLALVASFPSIAPAQDSPAPRASLSPKQAQTAVRVAREASEERRKRPDEPRRENDDPREYVVALDLVDLKDSPKLARSKDESVAAPREGEPPAATPKGAGSPGPLALVTTYRYRDDVTVFTTVDVSTGKAVRVEEAAHLRTALSDEEYEEARTLAKARSEPVKALVEKFGDKLSVYPQFSQFTVGDDPRIHRVIDLTYRVGPKDLSYPRPRIDLTTREVSTPAPEVFPAPRKPR
ncbi:hypothetical protein [Aquisphaera insulae]|uniref:hypothetical protein n=1 Tax=Aquisphaera insulae TaxID=2712864 RepID=UPI0013ED92C2|nr:hypothetical protein [Aquisphaera insulae]